MDTWVIKQDHAGELAAEKFDDPAANALLVVVCICGVRLIRKILNSITCFVANFSARQSKRKELVKDGVLKQRKVPTKLALSS